VNVNRLKGYCKVACLMVGRASAGYNMRVCMFILYYLAVSPDCTVS